MKTMIDILKECLPDGLEVVKVKEKASSCQAQIWFSYEGVEVVNWIFKTCAPGCERKLCMQTIASTMMAIAFRLGDRQMAECWKARLLCGEV